MHAIAMNKPFYTNVKTVRFQPSTSKVKTLRLA